MVKPPSPDNEITCRRGNADWAPIACDMALAMEPCQNDDALHRVCARTPNIRIGTERTFRNEPRVTALGVTLHDRPPLMEFACRFDTQCARPLEDTTDQSLSHLIDEGDIVDNCPSTRAGDADVQTRASTPGKASTQCLPAESI